MPSPEDRPSLVSVYRARHAHLVREVCRPALADGWTVALWALDGVVDDLAELTVGSGPGEKLPLLNGIVDAVRVRHEGAAGADYDLPGETDRLYAELAGRGLEGWYEVQTTLATWRPWQRSPEWTRR